MGKGAHVQIINDTTSPITSYTSNYHCLAQNGHNGSDPDYFNNLTVQGNGGQSNNQYIEAISSGTCAFETTTLTLTFYDSSGYAFSVLNFSENNQNWSANNQTISGNNIQVNDNSDNFTIVFLPPSSP